jgi:hypothetical protein
MSGRSPRRYRTGLPRALSRVAELPLLAGAWNDQARFVGGDDGLGAVPERQFGQYVTDMSLHRLFGDDQPDGYLWIGQALGDEPQYLCLPWCEPGERVRGRGVGR